MDYLAIDPHKSYDIKDAFCDEDGKLNTSMLYRKAAIHLLKHIVGL